MARLPIAWLAALALSACALGSSVALAQQWERRKPIVPVGRFAYVATHYEGTPRDDEYLLGLRVLLASVKQTGTPHDFVCLMSTNSRQSSIRLLQEDGCIVRVIPNLENPYKNAQDKRRTYKPRFEHTMNKLYLWNMTEYDRVIYMDEDNIAVHNMDEMFLCGHFCAILMNPINFHTGVMVVKPDTKVFNKLVESLYSLSVGSYDGADQGFLIEQFPNFESAPLFDPTMAKDGRPLDVPVMRMPVQYNVNHVWYYVRFSWEHLRRNGHPFSNETVPALSMGYPITPLAKPWCWWVYHLFMDMHWVWAEKRALLNESFAWLLTSRMVLLLAYTLCFRAYVRWLAARNTPPLGLGWLRPWLLKTAQAAPATLGYTWGVATVVIAIALLTPDVSPLIPVIAPPLMGWIIFLSFQFALVHSSLTLFTLALLPPQRSETPYVPYSVLLPAAVCAVCLLAVGAWLPMHSNFIGKLAWVWGIICATIIAQAHLFRQTAERASGARVHKGG